MNSKSKAQSDARIEKRIRTAHESTGCRNWETWTERVRLMEGGRADMTFDGCKEHQVALAR